MFDYTSRYSALDTAVHVAPDGREQPYVRRRFLPDGATLPLLTQVTVNASDRLDLITSRTLGVAEQFWQVCDANNAMNPFDLTGDQAIGTTLNVPLPQLPPVAARAPGST